MRITIATGPWLPVPALSGGAIPRMWQGLAEEFAKGGHDVCVFARSYLGQPNEEVIRGVRYLRRGGASQSLSIKADLLKDLGYAASNFRGLPAADILVTNDFWLPVFAGYLRGGAGRIVVNANRFPKGQYRLYKRAARVAAASAAVRDAIVSECPALASRTRVLPNPIDTSVMSPGARRRDVRTLLYAGRVHPEKGVHMLVEAFGRLHKRHPHLRLRVVGPDAVEQGGGGESYVRRLEELARGLPVTFEAPVFDPRRLADVYRDADLFCYPSLAEKGESFGVAPLEAMACGAPAVVSRLACFRDFISDGETGWFFDHRADGPAESLAAKLAEAVDSLSDSPAVSRSASEAAKRFSYTAVADQYLADFASLLT